MRNLFTFLSIIFAIVSQAQIKSPLQPQYGPGGKNYTHQSYDSAFYGTDLNTWCWIYEPASPKPDSACIIVYWHGSSSDMNYRNLAPGLNPYFEHLTRKGYIVIVPVYQYGGGSISHSLGASLLKNAFTILNGGSHVRPKKDAAGKIIYGMIGYSLGGGKTFDIANNYASYNIDAPKALCSESGIGASYNNILPSTKIVCIAAESDGAVTYATVKSIFDGLTTVPCTNKNLILMKNDYHGSPALVADHMMYLTGTDTADRNILNAYDWYGVWKYSVAIMDCGMKGTNCQYVLGYSDSIVNMGKWSDGIPVRYPDVVEPCASFKKASAPVFSQPAGNYYNPVNLSLSSTDKGAKIFYTLDGSDPYPGSLKYTGTLNLTIKTATVKARAYTGHDTIPSDIITNVYGIMVATPEYKLIKQPDGKVKVIISSKTDSALIYYTLNNASPSNTSTLYTDTLTLSNSLTIRSRAYKNPMFRSNVVDTTVVISNIEDIFNGSVSIQPVPFSSQLTIKLNVSADDYTIEIISEEGKIQFKKSITADGDYEQILNTQNWASGIYFVSISDSHQNKKVMKIVK